MHSAVIEFGRPRGLLLRNLRRERHRPPRLARCGIGVQRPRRRRDHPVCWIPGYEGHGTDPRQSAGPPTRAIRVQQHKLLACPQRSCQRVIPAHAQIEKAGMVVQRHFPPQRPIAAQAVKIRIRPADEDCSEFRNRDGTRSGGYRIAPHSLPRPIHQPGTHWPAGTEVFGGKKTSLPEPRQRNQRRTISNKGTAATSAIHHANARLIIFQHAAGR
jgi:hypothetical protein